MDAMRATVLCQECHRPTTVRPAELLDAPPEGEEPERVRVPCEACGEEIPLAIRAGHLEGELEECLLCGRSDFYRRKDFPRVIGCNVVLLAAVLSFWTYGLSLVAASLVELLIYRFVPWMTTCYRCAAEYRDVPVPEGAEAFDHHERDELVGLYEVDGSAPAEGSGEDEGS